MVDGFGDYSTSAAGTLLGQEKARAEIIDDFTEKIFDLLATKEENPLQAIVIEQLAKLIFAASRYAWNDLRGRSGTFNGRSVLGKRYMYIEPMTISCRNPKKSFSFLLLVKHYLCITLGTVFDPIGLFGTSPIILMENLQKRTLDSAQNLISILQDAVRSNNGDNDDKLELSNLGAAEIKYYFHLLRINCGSDELDCSRQEID